MMPTDKVYQPILKQSSYKNKLLESCEDIKSRVHRIKSEASICMQRRIVDINQEVYLQNGVLHDSSEKLDQTLAILTNLYYKLFLSSETRLLPIQGQQGRFCPYPRQEAKENLTRAFSDSIVQEMQSTKNKKLMEEKFQRKWGF